MTNKDKFINGPVNIIRLEGNINNTNKIIYLYCDFHIPPDGQFTCDNIRSVDVATHLINTFDKLYDKNNKKQYDFFMEKDPIIPRFIQPAQHLPSFLFDKQSKRKGHYMDTIIKIFTKSYNYDFKSNHVYTSSELPNVRLHYANIRGYVHIGIRTVFNKINDMVTTIHHNFSYDTVSEYIKLLKTLQNEIHLVNLNFIGKDEKDEKDKKDKKDKKYQIFEQSKEVFDKYSISELDDITKQIINKIKNNYTHSVVHDEINKIINNEFKTISINLINHISMMIKHIEENILVFIKDKDNNTLMKKKDDSYGYGINEFYFEFISFNDDSFHKLTGDIIDHGLYIMDMYLLRRMLDKDYISNSIIYTGAAHSLNYVRLLVKYFNFKVTHYSYINNDIKNYNEYIKNSKHFRDLAILFYPKKFNQCSNLKNFPELFT
jgi:hypothetical protein